MYPMLKNEFSIFPCPICPLAFKTSYALRVHDCKQLSDRFSNEVDMPGSSGNVEEDSAEEESREEESGKEESGEEESAEEESAEEESGEEGDPEQRILPPNYHAYHPRYTSS